MKKIIRMLLALVMSLTLCVLAFAADMQRSNAPETPEEIMSCFETVIENGAVAVIPLSDGVITQYSADNGDIVHVTELENSAIRYEYYCEANETIYSYSESAEPSPAPVQNTPVFETFDVAAYREENTTKYELSDAEENEIRKIMNDSHSQEECQLNLYKAGYIHR